MNTIPLWSIKNYIELQHDYPIVIHWDLNSIHRDGSRKILQETHQTFHGKIPRRPVDFPSSQSSDLFTSSTYPVKTHGNLWEYETYYGNPSGIHYNMDNIQWEDKIENESEYGNLWEYVWSMKILQH